MTVCSNCGGNKENCDCLPNCLWCGKTLNRDIFTTPKELFDIYGNLLYRATDLVKLHFKKCQCKDCAKNGAFGASFQLFIENTGEIFVYNENYFLYPKGMSKQEFLEKTNQVIASFQEEEEEYEPEHYDDEEEEEEEE